MSDKKMAGMTRDLDLFKPAVEEKSIAETRYEIVTTNNPLPSSDVNTPLQFRIAPSTDNYIDLANTMLELELKIQYTAPKDEDRPIPSTAKLALTNNVLMSLFSGLEVSLNNKTIVTNNNCLPWTAFLDVLSKYGPDARSSWLTVSGYNDEAPIEALTDVNKGRLKQFYNSKTGRYIGRIQHPFFRIEKLLVPGVEILITLYRNNADFLIMGEVESGKPHPKFTITFERAYLHLSKKKLFDHIGSYFDRILYKTPAVYEFNDVVVKPIIVPANVLAIDALINDGQLPTKIDIIQVNQAAVAGSLYTNPLFMNYYHLKYLAIEKNGQLLKAPYQVDFKDGNYLRPYLDYFRNSGCGLNDAGMSLITYEAYKNSYMIMTFNLTHFDECDNTLKPLAETGSLRLKVLYDSKKSAMPDSLIIMCLLTFPRDFAIDAHRGVTRN